MSSMAFSHVLHEVLYLQHAADGHLEAAVGGAIEAADDEHCFLPAVFTAGVKLQAHLFESFVTFHFHWDLL
jgi:hypothetical protein